MNSPEKVIIKPVPKGFRKIDGASVEDTLGILEEKGIDRLLCHPRYTIRDIFREHIIILTRADYHRFMGDGTFGEVEVGFGITNAGLYSHATYTDGNVERSEHTQLRLFNLEFSREDAEFLVINNLKLREAMAPYK